MPCESGLAECVVHIRSEGAGNGSGLLVAPDLVLTCAHVVDGTFYGSREGEEENPTPRKTVNACERLKQKIGQLSATVTAHDGVVRDALLFAVHDNRDMVLLQLDRSLEVAPVSPPLYVRRRLKQSDALLALGFLDDGRSVRLNCSNVSPSGNEDAQSGSVTAFFGQAEVGMSGGPIFLRVGDGFELAAMTCFGGGTIDFTGTIRDTEIRAFVAPDAKATASPGPASPDGTGYGLPQIVHLPLLPSRNPKAFVRCTPPAFHLGTGGPTDVVYVATHALDLSDVDALNGIERSPVLREARQRSIADFSEDELSRLQTLLKRNEHENREPWRDWLRPAGALELEQPLLGRSPAAPAESSLASEAIPGLPPERPKEGEAGAAFYAFPDNGLEWARTESGSWQRVRRQGQQIRQSHRTSAASRKAPRAAFRPALAVPVWAGAV
ncbi:serine protease [Fulvimarina sp. MAC3]|uniref:S1 family peptidase n=1 Tax=Fulvimarina sp. MAC3 TaxID=3148887 RepID=UPI0031FBF7B3